jgi:hypothetical protein
VYDKLAGHILGHIHQEYPIWTAQVLESAADLSLPRQRHPVFFGSFDWHSSVHSHWALVATLDKLEDAALAERVRATLDKSFTPELLAAEAKWWANPGPPHYERPYGYAWLFILAAELRAKNYSDWSAALQPLEAAIAKLAADWLHALWLPTRGGMHSQTAWGLWQTIEASGNPELAALAREKTQVCFGADREAPVLYELDQTSFFSASLNEAAAMAAALDGDAYREWLRGFLPGLFDPAAPQLPPVPQPRDASDPMEGHTVGLPLTRALAYRRIASGCPEIATRAMELAEREAADGLSRLHLDDYSTGHWTGSFAIAWLLGA